MMQRVIIKEDFLNQLKCTKQNHQNKSIDFMCTAKECDSRLICSICLLQSHYHHFSDITLLETFLEHINERTSKTIDSDLIEESHLLLSKQEAFLEDIQNQIRKNHSEAEQKLQQLEQYFQETCSKIKENLVKSQTIQLQKYEKYLEEIKTHVYNMNFEKQQIDLGTEEQLQTYIDQYFQHIDQIESPNRSLQQTLMKIKQIKYMEVKLDQEKLNSLNQMLFSLQNQQYFHGQEEFISHRCLTTQHFSTQDHKKLSTKRVIQTSHKKPIYKMLFLENESKIVTASEDWDISIWIAETGVLFKTMSGHTDRIWNLIELKDGRLASGSSDNKVRIWNLKTYSCDAVLTGHTGFVCAIMAYQNGLISGSQDKTLKFWNLASNKCIQTMKDPEQGKVMCLIMVSDREISCGSDSNINFYNLDSGKVVKTLTGHTGLIRSLLLMNNLDTLMSSSDDWTVRMWSRQSSTCLRVFRGHKHSVNFVLVYQEDIFVTVSDDSTIKFWNINQEEAEHTLTGHQSWVLSSTILKNGDLVTSGADKSIRFWSLS